MTDSADTSTPPPSRSTKGSLGAPPDPLAHPQRADAAPAPKKPSNQLVRIATALVGAPLIIGAVWLGGWVFAVVITVAALVAQHELYTMMERGGMRIHHFVGLTIGALLAAQVLVPYAVPMALAIFLLYFGFSPLYTSDRFALFKLASTAFGAIYPATLLGLLVALRESRSLLVDDLGAFWLTVAVFLLVWSADVFAYYAGRSLGRHKLAPRLSPNKTWEGAIGGALGAVFVAVGLKLLVLPFLAWIHVVMLALICGAFSQLGDLAESKIKRSSGVKDSGNILPGHGGVLDRLDALILAAPLAYLYLRYVAGLFGG